MVADILVGYSMQMQTRRQELLEHIQRRAAGGSAGSPRRLALSEVSINVPSHGGKKATETPTQQPPPTRIETTPINLPYGEYSPKKNSGGEADQWWDNQRIQDQLQQQSGVSPSAIFEPRNSPINTMEIFRQLKK